MTTASVLRWKTGQYPGSLKSERKESMKTERKRTDKKNDGHNKGLETANKKFNSEQADKGQRQNNKKYYYH